MTVSNRQTVHLSDYAVALANQLRVELGCDSTSELIEWLILCQRHSLIDARALLNQRSKRGRRWPVVVPDDFMLPPEG